jgi:hypothetical protein
MFGIEHGPLFHPRPHYISAPTEEDGRLRHSLSHRRRRGSPRGSDRARSKGIGASGLVAGLADGRFVVVWYEEGGDWDLRFNANGTPYSTADFVINATTPLGHHQPSVTALADGRFVVTWKFHEDGGDSSSDIRGRVFNANGTH